MNDIGANPNLSSLGDISALEMNFDLLQPSVQDNNILMDKDVPSTTSFERRDFLVDIPRAQQTQSGEQDWDNIRASFSDKKNVSKMCHSVQHQNQMIDSFLSTSPTRRALDLMSQCGDKSNRNDRKKTAEESPDYLNTNPTISSSRKEQHIASFLRSLRSVPNSHSSHIPVDSHFSSRVSELQSTQASLTEQTLKNTNKAMSNSTKASIPPFYFPKIESRSAKDSLHTPRPTALNLRAQVSSAASILRIIRQADDLPTPEQLHILWDLLFDHATLPTGLQLRRIVIRDATLAINELPIGSSSTFTREQSILFPPAVPLATEITPLLTEQTRPSYPATEYPTMVFEASPAEAGFVASHCSIPLSTRVSPIINRVLGSARIGYLDFLKVRGRMKWECEMFEELLSPALFARLPKDMFGRVPIRLLFAYVNTYVIKVKLYAVMLGLSYTKRDHLIDAEVDFLITYLIQMEMREIERSGLAADYAGFSEFCAFTISKAVFFLSGKSRAGALPIRSLLTGTLSTALTRYMSDLMAHGSSVLNPTETQKIREPTRRDVCFVISPGFAYECYESYINLNKSKTGVITRVEFSHFRNHILSPVFVNQLFQKVQTFPVSVLETMEEEKKEDTPHFDSTENLTSTIAVENSPKPSQRCIDYKTYVEFVVAFENRSKEPSIRYFFNIMDLNCDGKLTKHVLSSLFDGVLTRLYEMNDASEVDFKLVYEEILDMIKPASNDYITLEDLLASNSAHTVIGILTDVSAFMAYEDREGRGLEEDEAGF